MAVVSWRLPVARYLLMRSDPHSDDEDGSFAAGCARKSLSLPAGFYSSAYAIDSEKKKKGLCMAVDNDNGRSGHRRQGFNLAIYVWARQLSP